MISPMFLRQSNDIPAIVHIDKRKSSGEEVVAQMDHVRGREENDAVAVGVTVRDSESRECLRR